MGDELSVLEFEVNLVQVLGYGSHPIRVPHSKHDVSQLLGQ
jgi:hypothetical protein